MASQRLLKISAPEFESGEITSFSGTEMMSRPFKFFIELVSKKLDITGKKLVGQKIAVELIRAQGNANLPSRFFHGVVSRFSAGETFLSDGRSRNVVRRYRIEMVPWFWLLTQRSNCRVHNTDQPRPSDKIITKVFDDAGFSGAVYYDNQIRNPLKREFCVQYRESDFNFTSRLMEEEGIFYYFKHEESKHVLTLANAASSYATCVESTVQWPRHDSGQTQTDHLFQWSHEASFVPGKWVHTDYDFRKASLDLEQKTTPPGSLELTGNDKMEMFDYPGLYQESADGQNEIKIHSEESKTRHQEYRGAGFCGTFTAGHTFKLEGHDVDAENREYLLTSVTHEARQPTQYAGGTDEVHAHYSNHFTCVEKSVLFRPNRITPKPVINGVQTATVVGEGNDEITTNQYGQVKVHFHWDREGRPKRDETCSCWIRVAQMIAGNKYGFMAIPRVGQEVVVEFLEGDPDRPLIIGSVYNSDQMPHYDPPADKTKIYLKTNSSQDGEGFNELMFDDKKGSEQIFVHAEKDMDVRVKNDYKDRVLNDRHHIIGQDADGKKQGNYYEQIQLDKHVRVKNDLVEKIDHDAKLTIGHGDAGGGGNLDILTEATTKLTVEKDYHLTVNGNRAEKVDGEQSLIVAGDLKEKVGTKSLTVSGAHNEKVNEHSLDVAMNDDTKVGMNYAVDAGMCVHIKAGMSMVLEAGVQLSLKVGGNFIDINPAGIFIQGVLVNINSGGAAGSGAGANVTSPQNPVEAQKAEEAKPTQPKEAHNAKGGKSSRKKK